MPKTTNKRIAPKQPEAELSMNSDMDLPQRKVSIASLFSGAGGLEIAACRTGRVEAIVSTDSNATFLSTVERNMPTHFPSVAHHSTIADAKNLNGTNLLQLLGSTPDIVMGGPPCDDYTQYGKRRGHGGDKGPLIFEFLRIVDELKPPCFVFENVPNLAKQFRFVFDEFLEKAASMGYHLNWSLLKACDYGAPTQRVRIFLTGWKHQPQYEKFQFPETTHGDNEDSSLLLLPKVGKKPFRSVSDVLNGIPDVVEPGSECYFNHIARKHRPETVEHFKSIPKGKKVNKSFRYRSPWKGLIQSLTAGRDDSTKAYLHPIHHREMTVREYARIHGFPDSWVFEGTTNNGIKQVANSVPILLGEAVLAVVIRNLISQTT